MRLRAQFIELISWCQKLKEENPQQEKTDTKTNAFIQRITSSVTQLIEDSTLQNKICHRQKKARQQAVSRDRSHSHHIFQFPPR